MEYVILFAILLSYISMSSKLDFIKRKLDNKEKTEWNFNELVGRNVKISLDDEYTLTLEGELVSFDQSWIEVKVHKKYSNSEIHYKRIDKIKSIILKD